MMYQCLRCKNNFASQQRLESHLKRKLPCHNEQQTTNKITIGSGGIPPIAPPFHLKK